MTGSNYKRIYMSHPLDEHTPTYGDRDRLEITPNSQITNGVGANTSRIVFTNNHMGTHMDTPYHFCEDGKKTLDYLADELAFSQVALVKVPCDEARLITKDDIDFSALDPNIDCLFLKTGFEEFRSEDKYHNDNPGLAPALAQDLRNHFTQLRCVGFDFISLTSWQFRAEGRESHRAFLCGDHPLLVIEDVSFAELVDGADIDEVVVAPLRTADGNGGPVCIVAKVNQ